MDLPPHTKELVRGYASGAAAPISATSFLVFVVTGITALVAHAHTWPDKAWPWLLVLGCALFTTASVINAVSFMTQRDNARDNLKRHLDLTRYCFDLAGVACTNIADDDNSPNCILPVQFTLLLENVSSDTPIKYQIVQADFSVGNTVSDPVDGAALGVLPAGKTKGYKCGLMSGISRNDIRQLWPDCVYRIQYGHPMADQFHYETRGKLRLNVYNLNQDGYPDSWNYIHLTGPTFEEIEPG